MQPVTIRVASFNVGSVADWQTLYSRAKWIKEAKKDFTSTADLKTQKEALQAFEKAAGITKEQACQGINEKVNGHLGSLLREFNPDIICLQEYFYHDKSKIDNSHLPIKRFLESSGYEIVGETKPGSGKIEGRAIAYKSDVFKLIKSDVTFSAGLQEPARFADLKHKTSEMVVRVVSDYFSGMEGAAQKSQPKAKKLALPMQFAERIKFFEQNSRLAKGDIALDRSLNSLEADDDPDLIVYGLDANCTSKQSSRDKRERLHPKRLRLFELYKYQMDVANQAPTCLDANDWQPRKYDYICAKSRHAIAITDQIIEGVNHPSLLKEPGAVLSDHLPVLSTVIMQHQSNKCAIS